MKTILLCLLLMLPAAGAAGQETPETPAPMAADQFTLQAYQGKVVFLDFWASWCKPCRKSLPWLAEMQERYGADGLQVVAVNLDHDLKEAAAMMALLPPAVVLVHDPEGKLAEHYKPEGMPSAFVFGRDGKPAGRHLGFTAKDAASREADLKQLLNEGADHAK